MNERRARILVVEDDEILRDTLSEVIGDEGHEVRTAPNGQAALSVLAEWPADLIVLDVMMPVMDAFEFRRRQLQDGLVTDARVLILSAMRELDAAAERIGADAWLPKPFRLLEVLDAVDRLARDPAA